MINVVIILLNILQKTVLKMKLGTVYISSRGLKKASRSQIGAIDLDWSYENDFCMIKDFKLSETNNDILLSLMKIEEI